MTASRGKVLIIVENLPVPFDRRVWMESTTLRDNGYQVSVICPTGKGYETLYEEIDGIHVYRHNLPPEVSSARGYIREYSSALWNEWKLARKVLRERGFDVIHACNPPDLIWLVASYFKLLHRKRFIFDHHDLNPELYESKFNKRGLFYHALRLAERMTFLTADTVISTNESYREVALTRGKKRPERVHVVRSGPNTDRFKLVPPNPAYKKGREFMVGYLGVMGEFDGVDHLVRAAHELIVNRGRTDIQFCLVGGGPMLESLKALAKELRIEDYLEFTGRIPDAELIERLSTCEVCVNPDPLNPLNDKSTMNKILEYMALERPIVQYDLKEGRRSAEEASLYAEPNNIEDFATKIEDLLADPEARQRMGEIGRRRMVDSLEWKHQIPKLLRAYESTLGSAPVKSSVTQN
jgi:glycosyltransferase involved in cell wall biosynthesis